MADHTTQARAAVLARLWGALAREPIAGIRARRHTGPDLIVNLHHGRELRGPAAAAEPFAVPPDDFTLAVDGERHDRPGPLLSALDLPGHTARLRAELDNSVANLTLARQARPNPDGGPPLLRRHPTVAAVEQLVVDGHPLHPCCRTRIGLTPADVVRYAPEHRPTVDLAVIDVPAERWHTTGTGLPPRLLMHPWQRDRLLDRHPHLRDTGATVPAHPLMSLRTLAPVGEPDWHVKTAVDVQMTSAVRTVSPAAVHNGPALSRLLAPLAGDLEILAETAGGAVLVDGAPCRGLAMIRRRAPRPGTGEVIMPLAALAAHSPADGRPLAVEAVTLGYPGRPADFLADLVHLLFPPLTRLLHLGIALEAHGQNLAVALRAGRPVRLLYRDFGGVRVSPARLARHGVAVPPLLGDLVSDDPDVLRTKVAASALAGVVGEVVAVLVREYALDATDLWRVAAVALHRAYDALPDDAHGDRVALGEDPLPVKATTTMRLAGDPLSDRWARLPNPMAGAR